MDDWIWTVKEVQQGLDTCLCEIDRMPDEVIGAIYRLRYLFEHSRIKSGPLAEKSEQLKYGLGPNMELVKVDASSSSASSSSDPYRINERLELENIEMAIQLSLGVECKKKEVDHWEERAELLEG
jgi:hypothetical protein